MPQCQICLEKEEPVFLECGHQICILCVIQLIKKRLRRCPFCRTPIRYVLTPDSKIKPCYP